MAVRSILDSRLRHEVPQFWTSRITIQNPVETLSDSKQPMITGYTPVVGMEDLECRMAPITFRQPTDNENRSDGVISGKFRRDLLINAYLPQITVKQRALVDGIGHDIVGIEPDSQKFFTRLRIEDQVL